MRAFRFRLERLLNVRKNYLKQKERELANLLAILEQRKRELEEFGREKKKTLEDFSAQLQKLPLHLLQSFSRHVDFLEWKILQAKEKVEYWKKVVEKKREEVMEARRNVEILERLRERRYRAWLKEFRKEQQRQIDEFGVLRHDRLRENA